MFTGLSSDNFDFFMLSSAPNSLGAEISAELGAALDTGLVWPGHNLVTF